MMETLVSLLVWATDKVWPFPVLIVVLALGLVAISRMMGVPQSSTPLTVALCALLICIPFGTPALFFFGSRLTAPLIYHYGTPGQAVIVSSRQTGDIFNDRPVRRYTVMLQKADGERLETQFDSSDFNVYPGRREVRYPAEGQPFEVRYLARQPRRFVMLLP
ncbi:hypothetical protein ACFWP0_22115 [Achromobacter sp. NPDC058515]|uniref:hypothetical protein n=1 Tax=Achromobacter sp. NPDC058515 TaxID=3346533 RepID=UPI003665A23A